MGASVAASSLNDCAKLSLCVEVAGSPNEEAYGLAAVSKMVSPAGKAIKK